MPIFQSKLLKFVGSSKDYIYSPVTTALPSKVDLRAYIGGIENQITINSCTANCVVSACELILQANDQFVNLSRIFNYYESRKHIGFLGTDSGSYLRDAVAAAYHVGLPTETLYPYDVNKINTAPPQAVYDEAILRTVTRYERIWDGYDYTWEDGTGNASVPNGSVQTIGSNQWVRDIKSALSEGYPLVVGIPITQDFYDITGNFEYQFSHPYTGVSSNNPDLGGHAVVIVGYDDAYNAFIIENSWGNGWGYGGLALIPYDASDEFFEAWVIKGFAGHTVNLSASVSTTTDLTDLKYDFPINAVIPTDPVYFFNGAYAMAVTSNDLVWRKSTTVSATPEQNGGAINLSATVTSNVKNNLFPDVSQTERTNGSVVYRKLFLHINKYSQDELLNARISMGGVTPADDFVVFYTGTKTDTEASLNISRPYGAGTLTADAGAGATSITVTPENLTWATTHTPIRTGDVICISDGTNTDYVTASAVTYDTNVAITCSATTHAFTTGALVSAVYSVASTKANYAAPVVTSTAGTYTSVDNIVVNAKGTVDQVWTLTFTNTTSFTVTGNTLGTIGTGTRSSDTAITNPAVSVPYFTLKSIGFGGTYAIGDTIVFSTTSATIPLWLARVVPAGTSDVSNNYCSLTVNGESY